MDLHTDTTTHLAAEEAKTPAHAAGAMSAAIGGPAEGVSLSELLARRNRLVDAANALLDPPNEELDAAAVGYEAIEAAIRETRAESVDDVVTKIALVAEFVRESGCPDQDDVENLLDEARRVLTRACDPMHTEAIDRRDAHWSLLSTTGFESGSDQVLPIGWPNAETLDWHRKALTVAVMGATARPSPEIHAMSVDTLLRTPSLSAGDRHSKFLCIAEAAFPEAEFTSAEMAAWSVDTSLPMERRLIGALLLDLRLDAERETAERDRSHSAKSAASHTWNSARAALETAKKNLKAARAAVAAAEQAVDKAAPVPEILVIDRKEDGSVHRCYIVPESIERDFRLPDQRTVRDLMLAAQKPWREAWEAAKERFNLEALEEAEEAAFDAWRAAYAAIVDLPPPDVGAMAYKAAVLILDDCFNQEYDGPTQSQIEALLLDDGAKYAVAKIFQDIEHLAAFEGSVTGRAAIREAWEQARAAAAGTQIETLLAAE